MSTHSTKTKILHEASKLLLTRGFNGLSLQDLALNLNIKKASLFHHYPSKKALAIELCRFYQREFKQWVKRHEDLAAEKQIIIYTETLTSWIVDKERVCPVGALGPQWQLVAPEIQDEIKKLHRLHKSWLTKQFKKIEIRIPKPNAVIGAISLLQGSIQIARMNKDSTLVNKNMKSYLKSIKA
jgi:TetR/AcrR family transcriptional repressor of nem operon